MRPAPFEYAATPDVDQAIDLLGQFGDEAKVLAGWQSLV
jgi:carbon-monoxide dehydrogenase medium subunit